MLSLTPTDILADPGTAVALVVVARDAQLNPIQATVTASSANTAVATIEPDTSRIFPDGATYAFLVHVVGVSGDSTHIAFSGASVQANATVTVN